MSAIEPGKSVRLVIKKYDLEEKYAKIGVKLPDPSDLSSAHIYPFLRVFGNASVERLELSDPIIEM